MPLTDNLIAYWKMDETSGNRADSEGSYTLTDNGSVGSAAGILTNAADFAATNFTYLSQANVLTDLAGGSCSISFWLWLDTTGSYRAVYESQTDQNEFSFLLDGTTGLYLTVGGHAEQLTSSAAFTTGAWQHVVVVYDLAATSVTVYRNGTSVATDNTGWTAGPDTRTLIWGANINGGGSPLDGRIDEAGVWSRPLTSGEVTTLYGGGSPPTYENLDGGATTKPTYAYQQQ